jgi:cytochrome c
MSRFPKQLALVSVSVIAVTGGAIYSYERRAHEAELAAQAALATEMAAQEAAQAEIVAAEGTVETPVDEPVEVSDAAQDAAGARAEAADDVAEAVAPAEADAAASDETVAEADTSAHGHGDAGTAPLASIIAGAAVAQSVDSPALDATGVSYGLGREALPQEVAAWDIDVRPDGTGLPEGEGDVWTGEQVFIEQCAACHGDFAEGIDRWPTLAGGLGTPTHDRPEKTIGSYWPYLSTVFDYVNRAMPYGYAQSLEPDQIYAITAYLLYSNGIVEDDFVLNQENFAEVELPNEGNFFMDDREEGELVAFRQEPCMENCKEDVEITMRAMVLDVTPETAGTATTAAEIDTGSAEDDAQVTETAAAAPEESVARDAPAEEAVEVAAADPELVAAGEAAFRECKTCHMVGEDAKNRVGPHLNDVIGRTAGSVEGFRYSGPMQEAGEEGLVWTAETIHDFLMEPRDYIEGTKMSFRGFSDEADIAAVTAYLATFSQ